MEDLTKDCYKLLSKVLSDTYQDFILIHLVQTEYLVLSFEEWPEVPTCYGYVVDQTPLYLRDQGILTILSKNRFLVDDNKRVFISEIPRKVYDLEFNLLKTTYKKFTGRINNLVGYFLYPPSSAKHINLSYLRGLYYVVIDRKKAQDWVDKRSSGLRFLDGIDYYYENGVLFIKLNDGSSDVLDLSKAPTLRPLFEAFFYLFKNTGQEYFTREEVIDSYYKITKKVLLREKIAEWKSDIMGKMIRSKPSLEKRIIWWWDKEKKKWGFKILSLSEVAI